jgi:hypothetical protein
MTGVCLTTGMTSFAMSTTTSLALLYGMSPASEPRPAWKRQSQRHGERFHLDKDVATIRKRPEL